MIRVLLPQHLRTLAGSGKEVTLQVDEPVTISALLDALEAEYPSLLGTIRDHQTKKRRSLVRYFACEEDLSFTSPDQPLPDAVVQGKEPFWIVGAIAGG